MSNPTSIVPMTQTGAIKIPGSCYPVETRRLYPALVHTGTWETGEFSMFHLVEHTVEDIDDPDEIPEDYGSEMLTVETENVKVINFYCDLDADADWDDSVMWTAEDNSAKQAALDARNFSGDGSHENPWRNLTVALEKIKLTLQKTCCGYIRLICSGTAHYTACAYNSSRQPAVIYGSNRFILEGAQIETNGHSYCFYEIRQSVMSHCQAVNRNPATDSNSRCYLCHGSSFSGCSAEFIFSDDETLPAYVPSCTGFDGMDFCCCTFMIDSEIFLEQEPHGQNCVITAFSGSNFYQCRADFAHLTNVSSTGFAGNGGIAYQCEVNMTSATPLSHYQATRTLRGFYDFRKMYDCSAYMESSVANNPYYNCNATGFYWVADIYRCTAEMNVFNCDAIGFESATTISVLRCYNSSANISAETHNYDRRRDVVGFTCRGNGFLPDLYIYLFKCSASVSCITTTGGDTFGIYADGKNVVIYKGTVNVAFVHDSDRSAWGIRTGSGNFIALDCQIKVVCHSLSPWMDAEAYARGISTAEGSSGELSVNGCTFELEASASATPSGGAFREYEAECEVNIGSTGAGCLQGYRCEIRTQNGTTSC